MDEITIAGYAFKVPRPFRAGHVCTQAEAEVLNRKLHENIRGNFSKRVKEATSGNSSLREDGILKKLQTELDDYSHDYVFGGDSIASEALVIATDIVRRAIKANGKNLSNYSKSDLASQAEVLLRGKLKDQILCMARERVSALQAAAQAELERQNA